MDIIQIMMLVWGFVWGVAGVCITCGAILAAVDHMIERWVKRHGDSSQCHTKRDK